jgi:hypothetical protein
LLDIFESIASYKMNLYGRVSSVQPFRLAIGKGLHQWIHIQHKLIGLASIRNWNHYDSIGGAVKSKIRSTHEIPALQ